MVRGGGAGMKRERLVIVGMALVGVALTGALFHLHAERRAHAQSLAWSQVDIAAAHLQAASNSLSWLWFFLDDTLPLDRRHQGLTSLNTAIETLLRGEHAMQVAVAQLPEGTAVPLGDLLESARLLEDALRVVASFGPDAPRSQRERWVRTAHEASVALGQALAHLRQAIPQPHQPWWPWWVWGGLAGIGVLVGGGGIWSRRQVLADRPSPVLAVSVPEFVDGIPVPAILVDGQGLVRWVNPAAATYLGLPAGHDVGCRWADVEERADGEHNFLLAREVALRRSDGTVVWAMRATAPLHWERTPLALYLLWDITSRREVEAYLRQEAENWRGMAMAMDCGLALVDPSGEVVAVNSTWAMLAGLKEEAGAVAGRRLEEVAPGPLLCAPGPWWHGEWAGRWLLGGIFPWPAGGVGARSLLLVDAGLVRHEGLRQGQRAGLALCAKALARIEEGLLNPQALGSAVPLVVTTFLALIQFRQGQWSLRLEPTSLVALARKAVAHIRSWAEHWGVGLHLALGPLPDKVLVDAALLRQAVEQLLWGTCLRAKGARVILGLESATREPEGVQLTVVVQGPGVPPPLPEDLEALLDISVCDDETLHLLVAELSVRALGASGVMRQVVANGTRMQFTVELAVPDESSAAGAFQPPELPPGEGIATAALPEDAAASALLDGEGALHGGEAAALSEGAAASAQGHEARPGRLAPPGHGFQVLVAEDNPFNAALLESLLVRLGARRVMVVDDGLQLVEAALAEPTGFDLAVVDVELPGLDGVAAVHRLREQGIGLPVVGVTAHTDPSRHQACAEAGMAAVLTKPYDMRQIAGVLRWIGVEVAEC